MILLRLDCFRQRKKRRKKTPHRFKILATQMHAQIFYAKRNPILVVGKMKKKEASSQGELTENPNDKDPFRRKQQRTLSGESGVPRDGDGASVPQLKARLGLAETAYSLYGIKGKERYKGREMPRICVEIAKRLKGRKYT